MSCGVNKLNYLRETAVGVFIDNFKESNFSTNKKLKMRPLFLPVMMVTPVMQQWCIMESRLVAYWWVIGISFSPSIAGRGASTVSTPSLLRDDLMLSGFVPLGSMNSRLYSRYTDLLSVFSSCLA
jgi:hypothetical protein